MAMKPADRKEYINSLKRGDVSIIAEVAEKYGLGVKGFGDDDSTLLHQAIKEGQLEFVTNLLAAGADINETNNRGEMAIHYAARHRRLPIAKLLLQKFGISITYARCKNEKGETLLHVACQVEDVKFMEWLLDDLVFDPLIGATLSGRRNVTAIHYALYEKFWISLHFLAIWQNGRLLQDAEDSEGNNPIHCAAKLGLHDQLRFLVKECKSDVDIRHRFTGTTAFQETVMLNLKENAHFLVNELGADVNASVEGKNNWRGLHLAVHLNDPDTLKRLLIDFKADANIKDGEGNTPLHLAVRLKRIDLAEILLKDGKSRIESRNRLGRTPLALVCGEHGDLKTAQFLVEKWHAKMDVRTKQDDCDGGTPLHIALAKGNVDCASFLIETSEKSVFGYENAVDEDPIHFAVRKKCANMVKFLLFNKAPVNEIHQRTGRTLLHFVAVDDDVAIAKILLDFGAKTYTPSLRKKDANYTPIMLAAHHGSTQVFQLLLDWEIERLENKSDDLDIKIIHSLMQEMLEIAERLDAFDFIIDYIKPKADLVNIRDTLGRTLLHVASMTVPVTKFRLKIVKKFIRCGSEVNARSLPRDLERTPLMFAAMFGNDDVIELLAKSGARLELRDSNNNTALHLAALSGRLSTVKKLVSLGAYVGERGFCSRSALHQASIWTTEQNDEVKTMQEIRFRPYKREGVFYVEAEKVVSLSEEAYENKVATVNYLIEQMPALATVQDDNDDRAVHLAASTGHIDIVRYFIDWRPETFLEARGNLGRTPFQHAILSFQMKMAEYLVNVAKASLNAASDAGEDKGRTALHIFTSKSVLNTKILSGIKWLITWGANLDLADFEGDRPLHYAVESCDRDASWRDVISLLVDAGADTLARNKKGQSPLGRAAASQTDKVKTIDFLLQLGVYNNDDVDRAIAVATKANNVKIVKYLQKYIKQKKAVNNNTGYSIEDIPSSRIL